MTDIFVRSTGGVLLPSGPWDADDMASLPRGPILRVGVNLATQSDLQRRRMWAMVGDVMKAQPDGRRWDKETWKRAFMHYLGHEIVWQPGLDGRTPFPADFRSSKLSREQMRDLIDCIGSYGAEHGVVFREPQEAAA